MWMQRLSPPFEPSPSGQGSVEGLIIDEVLMARRTMEMGGI
jgi:hypothetical protein